MNSIESNRAFKTYMESPNERRLMRRKDGLKGKYGLAKAVRVATTAPIMAAALVALLYFLRPGSFLNAAHAWLTVTFLSILPVMAYPVSYLVPALRKKGRDGQRSLAIVFSVIGYILGCALCFLGYAVFDGVGLFAFLRRQGYPIKLSSSIHLTFTGLYYANITPSSSGGQPMQVYLLNQRGVPVGVSSSALSVRLMANQLMIVLMTTGLWIANGSFIQQQLGGVKGIDRAAYLGDADLVARIREYTMLGDRTGEVRLVGR